MNNFKKILFLIGFIVIGIQCHAQRYFNELSDYDTQNHESFSSVVQLKDSGYIAVGFSFSFSTGYNYYTVRFDKFGQKINQNFIQSFFLERQCMSIKKITDTTFIICGLINDLDSDGVTRTNRDMYLVKIKDTGDTLWTKRFGLGIGTAANPDFEIANDVVVTSDNGFAMVGYTSNLPGSDNQVYLVKTDSVGNFLWHKTFGGNASDAAYAIIETSDRGFLLSGTTYSYGAGDRDGYLIKTDSVGNFLWQKTYGGGGGDGLISLCNAVDTGYLIGGWLNLDLSNAMQNKLWLIKTNNNGDTIWTQTFGGEKVRGLVKGIIQLNDSSIVVYGSIKDTIGMSNAGLILKANNTGDSLWAREYKRTVGQDDYFNGFNTTNDGGFIMTGQVNQNGTPTNTQDGWLVKVDCMGADSITHYFGDTCYTNQIGIKEIQYSEAEIVIYPNPASDAISIYMADNDELQVSIENILGQKVYEGIVNGPVNIKQLERGIFLIKLYKNNKLIASKKMIKE